MTSDRRTDSVCICSYPCVISCRAVCPPGLPYEQCPDHSLMCSAIVARMWNAIPLIGPRSRHLELDQFFGSRRNSNINTALGEGKCMQAGILILDYDTHLL